MRQRFTAPLLWRLQARPAHPNRLLWTSVAQAQEQARWLRDHNRASLRNCADDLRRRARATLRGWQSLDVSRLAFAAVIEACRRIHGVELFDVQVVAGFLLGRGCVVEMQTGEGKTFASALPAFLFSLTGEGVHVATPNAYLAGRDFQLLRPVYELLGCSVGLLPDGAPLEAKRAAYASDITYGTGYEFGFDYLREQLDNLRRNSSRLGSQLGAALAGISSNHPRPISRGFAIVDEVDSVLVDEACTPLVLSAAARSRQADDRIYREAIHAAKSLRIQDDYVVDDQERSVWLTENGRKHCYEELLPATTALLKRPWSDYVRQALHATQLLRREVDYVVAGDQVVLVDAMTGRLCGDRSWRDGLHQMVEVKEGLSPSGEGSVAAQITRQRYFGQYGLLCGMSGTVLDAAGEFYQTYGLRCGLVPPRQPSQRRILPPRFFATSEAKYSAVVRSIRELHATGRPVLVGSRTIENSQRLASALAADGISFQLLNGKQTADEAAIVARAAPLAQ